MMVVRKKRRIDDILFMADELLQAIRVEGDLLGEAKDNDEADKEAQKIKTDSTGQRLDHPVLDASETGSQKGNSLRDIVDDDVKREKVVRGIDLAVEEVGDMLYPYTKMVCRHPENVLSNVYKEPEFWQMSLDVPITMGINTTHYLKTLGNEYIVARVVYDWCAMFYAEKIQWAAARVEDLKEKICAAKDRRVLPVRRCGSVY